MKVPVTLTIDVKNLEACLDQLTATASEFSKLFANQKSFMEIEKAEFKQMLDNWESKIKRDIRKIIKEELHQ